MSDPRIIAECLSSDEIHIIRAGLSALKDDYYNTTTTQKLRRKFEKAHKYLDIMEEVQELDEWARPAAVYTLVKREGIFKDE